jgi:hypothetical protein
MLYRRLLFCLFLVHGFAWGPTVLATDEKIPELRFEAPPPLEEIRAALAATDSEVFAEIANLVGLQEPGPAIRIVLAPEGSPEAQRAPGWVLGYAYGNVGQVVLLPARVPGYPDTTLQAVLRHEVAHVYIARAAKRQPVPRWFNEGLALVAARDWSMQDRSRLIFATLRRGHLSLDDLSRQFPAGAAASSRAYALSGAFMRHLINRYGREAPSSVLHHLARGETIDVAFRRSTGLGLAQAEERFWRELSWWNKWFPFLTSSFALWLAITGLALLAFRRRHSKDQEQLARWEEEESREVERRLDRLPTDPQIH